MKTPNTPAGFLTEKIMSAILVNTGGEYPANKYNRIYEAIFGTLDKYLPSLEELGKGMTRKEFIAKGLQIKV